MNQPKWLEWVRELQAIAQSGLAYTQNPFDIERFQKIQDIAAQIAATYSDEDLSSIQGLFQGEAGYATPKVDVRGAVFKDDAILLVRENLDRGRWTLPGGWADITDTPSQAVLREIREESGYEARPLKLVAVYDRNRRGHTPFFFSIYKLFFLCELAGGSATTSVETSEVAFFREHELPLSELSLGRVTAEELHTLFKHYRQPDLPTEFD